MITARASLIFLSLGLVLDLGFFPKYFFRDKMGVGLLIVNVLNLLMLPV